MADAKVTALSENTTVATTDMLYLVDDPGGTPASEKATVANVCLAGQPNIGARVYNSGNLTIPTASSTDLTFDSERWDTDTIHSTVTNTERLTATTAGTYLIAGTVRWAANSTNVRGVRIKVGGGNYIASNRAIPDTGGGRGEIAQTVSTIWVLEAGHYVTLSVYQDSGGNLDVVATASYTPEFMMQRIG